MMKFIPPSLFLVLCLFIAISATGSVADSSKKHRRSKSELRKTVTEESLEEIFKESEEYVKERLELEKDLVRRGRVVKQSDRITDPSVIRNRRSDPIIRSRALKQLVFHYGSEILFYRYNLTREEMAESLRDINFTGDRSYQNADVCNEVRQPALCDENARYRTANGQCNNLQNPEWGSARTCQRRLQIAQYIGNSGIRRSVKGGPLPAPRTLSLNLHYHLNRPTNYVTHMYMFYGQLLDHDIAFTPVSTTVDNQGIQCCPQSNKTHPQCLPIIIQEDDPFYSRFGITCLNFVRSAICPTCSFGHKQVVNQVTSFIDASFVYGNSENLTRTLRTNDGTGRLRVQKNKYGDLMPPSPDPINDQCSFPKTNDICFFAGDFRVNQHTLLASLHTVFLREHNRLADGLRLVNPHWDDETLFQEARRIVGALMQVITYKEYLPVTLGEDRMSYFKLWLGDSPNYDPLEDPTLTVEFTTAAFRFGHSLINSVVTNRPLNDSNQVRLLRNEFFQPFDLYKGLTGPLVGGASNSPAQWFDQHLVPDVTNYLYRIRGNPTGLDLAAFNINRGRDHGIPIYVDMVRYCSRGEIVVQDFNDLVSYGLMEYNQAEALRTNYRDVKDVDLWTGILMEIPNENAVVGPTTACVVGLQFKKLKYGDRFYFEHNNVGVQFTCQQMEELSKMGLSKIICLNTDVQQMALNAMLFKSKDNPTISCKDVKGVDLSYWKDENEE